MHKGSPGMIPLGANGHSGTPLKICKRGPPIAMQRRGCLAGAYNGEQMLGGPVRQWQREDVCSAASDRKPAAETPDACSYCPSLEVTVPV